MKILKKRQIKRLYWFINRVGREIFQMSTIIKEIRIEGEMHAKALYLTQIEKGFIYNEIPTNPKKLQR